MNFLNLLTPSPLALKGTNVWAFVDTADKLGDSTYPIANGEFTALTIVTATISGTVSGNLNITDGNHLQLGTDDDIVFLNRASILGADTILAGVLEGTVESQAIAANSLMISNITNDGDIAMYVSKAGSSQMFLWADGSTGDTALLAASGASVDVYIAGTKEIDYATGVFAFQQATTLKTTTGALTIDGDDGIVLQTTGSGGVESRDTLILGTADQGTTARTGETLRASDMVGGTTADAAGADLTIAAGLGTGTGDAGQIIFQLPSVVGAGTTIHNRATAAVLDMAASTTVMSLTLGVAGSMTGTLALSGVTSGVVTIQPADAAGTYTLTLPTTDGDASQFLQTNGSGVLTWATQAVPTTITVADEATDTTCFPLFVTAATGDLAPKSNAGLAFNSNTGLLTATGFSGPLTGNVTGDVTGSAATVTGAAQSAITSVGTLTSLGLSGLLTLTIATDAASVQTAILQGDRATITDGDEAYVSLKLSDSLGNQDEQARITWKTTTVLDGATQDGDLILSALVNNVLTTMLTLDGSAGTLVSAVSLDLGANSITMSGSIGVTGTRVTKLWATDIESTNAITIGGAAVYYSGGTDVAVADGGTGGGAASITLFNNITGYTASGATGTTSTNLVFSAAPTFTTSITDPLVIGGTGTTSTLSLRATSGVGTTGADIILQTGNNGATEVARFYSAGQISFPQQASFRAYKNASTQTVTTGGAAKVTLDAEDWDIRGEFATSTFTPTVAGKYLIVAQIQYQDMNAATRVQCLIYKNGAAEAYTSLHATAASTNFVSQVQGIVDMNGTTDYIDLYTLHDKGTDGTITNGRTVTWMAGYKLM